MKDKKNIKKPSNENKNKFTNERKDSQKDYNKIFIICLTIIIVILVCAIAYLVYKGNHPKLSDGKQVVASIDGKDFTAEDLYAELNSQGGYSVLMSMIDEFIIEKEIEDTTDAKQYADSIVAQYELQYKESNISFEDAVISSGYESIDSFKKAVMNNYLYTEVGEKYIKKDITEKELKKYYDDYVSDELNVKHILIQPDVDSKATSDEKKKAEEAALKKAKELIKQLDEGANFETLAKENSDDTGSASSGGVINNVIKKDYVTEFWDASYKLEVNTYTKEPVKSTYGYHIIYKVSHTEKKSFEEIKDTLYDDVVDQKIKETSNLVDKTWIEIRKNYNLNIIDSNIQRVYNVTIKNIDK